MVVRTLLIISTALFSVNSRADDEPNVFNYRAVHAYDSRIDIAADLVKHTITLRKLDINNELPIGRVNLTFPTEYTVGITKINKSSNGEISIYGNDYNEAVGTKITISYYNKSTNATVRLESQYEEMWLVFVPQLLKLEFK